MRYRGLWPGVDLLFRGEGGQCKSEFHLAPGARLDDIRFVYQGAVTVRIGTQGDLQIETPRGVLTERRPATYRIVAGRREPVDCRFVLYGSANGETAVGFELQDDRGPEDRLEIDPVLAYVTYLGGSAADRGFGIAIDRRVTST